MEFPRLKDKRYPHPYDNRFKQDQRFYDEWYYGENEICFYAIGADLPILHIWDGYFYDIFRNAPLHGLGWRGFTRDYQQCEGPFDIGVEDWYTIPNLDEYIEDLLRYQHFTFECEDTRKAYNALVDWLGAAKKSGCKEVIYLEF